MNFISDIWEKGKKIWNILVGKDEKKETKILKNETISSHTIYEPDKVKIAELEKQKSEIEKQKREKELEFEKQKLEKQKEIVETNKAIEKIRANSSHTIYEPDKVKAMELANQTMKDKLKVTELENRRMEMAIEAQKEIIQMNKEMQIYIMEAHQKGFENSVQILKEMMISLNKIAQERLLLIENGHFEVVKNIENLYLELEKEIRDDNDDFNLNKLPQMMEILSRYDADSPAAKLYAKSIDKQIEINATFFTKKLDALHERQRMMVESAIQAKEKILDNSSKIVEDRMKFLEKQLEAQQKMEFNIPQMNLNSNKNEEDIIDTEIEKEK